MSSSDGTGYDALMQRVCVGLGYCGWSKDGRPLHVDDFIPETGLVTAEQFVEWVFRTDGIDPADLGHSCHRHSAAIRAAFVEHMGGDVIDASKLRWSCA